VESERERAFIAVHKESYPQVYRFVRRRLESAELAEELAADVFRIVWQKWGDEPRTDIAWLLTVARNLIGNAYRSRDRMLALQEKLRTAAEPLSGTESEDLVVHDVLAALRDSDRDILQLAYWDELTFGGDHRCAPVQ
jgi:RNA polymerase sigma-70 factor (ECF subfamily)